MRIGDYRIAFEETATELIVTRIGPRGSVYDWRRSAMNDDNVTLTRAEYEALIDARDHAVAMRGIANGSIETQTESELDAYLATPTPLAYWRGRRGLTQVRLAKRAGISQPYVAQIESGSRVGDVATLATLAKVLAVRIDDLVVT